VHVPHGYTGERAVALVLNLHGSASTASRQEAATGLDATADRYTFIVAFPQGDRRAGPGFSWNVPGVPVGAGARQADDVGFLGQVVSLLRRRYCIDRGEIYASGFSGGARMVSQAVCHPSSPFAAMAVVGGLRAPVTCPAGRAVPVLAFHGTADSMNPYNGHGQSYWTYSVPAAATRWAGYDGCTGTPVTVRPFPSVAVTGYGGCHDAASVELYTLIGKGHRWPGVETLAGAGTAFDANAIMWRFFSAHPLR
jgi:polyhydroxybutyrate depolymerase